MVFGAPVFVPAQLTSYWQAGDCWTTWTLAVKPVALNCPVIDTVNAPPLTAVGETVNAPPAVTLPAKVFPACVSVREVAPGECNTTVVLPCTGTAPQLPPGTSVTAVGYDPATDSCCV